MSEQEVVIDPATLKPIAEGVTAALNKSEQPAADAEKVPLTVCPCGRIPDTLMIEVQPRGKYGRVQGDCCGDWMLEFKAGFNETPEQLAGRAKAAWETARRAG